MVRYIILILWLGCAHLGFAKAVDIYPLKTPEQRVQLNRLLGELRCLVCQNQDLADSSSGLAADLRSEVYNMVNEGKADQQIIDHLTERYGDFILFKPPFQSTTFFLWLAPLLLLGLGLMVFKCCVVKRT